MENSIVHFVMNTYSINPPSPQLKNVGIVKLKFVPHANLSASFLEDVYVELKVII